jgi:hypothetical protein
MKRLTALASMVALCLATAMPMPAMADQNDYVQHQHDCLGLLFSNPDLHATECGGPFSLGTPKTIETPGSGAGCPDYTGFRSGAGEAQFLTVAVCCVQQSSAPLPEGNLYGGMVMNVEYCNYGDNDNYSPDA